MPEIIMGIIIFWLWWRINILKGTIDILYKNVKTIADMADEEFAKVRWRINDIEVGTPGENSNEDDYN